MMQQVKAGASVSAADKKRLIDRLARVEGQLRGVQRMIAVEEDCERIVQQLAAARGALHRAFVEIIACALRHRLADHAMDEPEMRDQLREVVDLLSKYN